MAPKAAKPKVSMKSTRPARKAKLDSDASSSSDDSGSEDEYKEGSAAVEEEEDEEEDAEVEVIELDSDDLDGSEPEKETKKKRKSSDKVSSGKKTAKVKNDGGKNTREVKAIKKVAAPKEKADTSVILPSTMDFLLQLSENNEREWFWEHEPLYRHTLVNWNSFVTALVPVASGADWTLPHLPAKDLVHRIARDVRFSNNKTPYKTNLAASLSRTGRKGIFALYYIQIQPGGRSLIAAGVWQPGSSELSTIRHSILRDPAPLRKAISEPAFVKLFGEPKAKKGARSSVYGQDDELKNCPKLPGVTKEHKDIDLLKLRSIAVSKHFTDAEVLSPDFIDTVRKVMEVLCPFVQCINEMISPTPQDDDDDADDADDAAGGDAADAAEEEGGSSSGEEVLVDDSDDGFKEGRDDED